MSAAVQLRRCRKCRRWVPMDAGWKVCGVCAWLIDVGARPRRAPRRERRKPV